MPRLLTSFVTAVLLLAGSSALGQSFNDPEGTPLGCTERSGRGPKLSGFTVIEFVDVDGLTGLASSARVFVRLGSASDTAAFFTATGAVDTNDFGSVRDALVSALEVQVKERFFPESCAADACPTVHAILRCFDNVAITDDGGDDLIMAADVVIQLSERP
jgi:hypothetical protein